MPPRIAAISAFRPSVVAGVVADGAVEHRHHEAGEPGKRARQREGLERTSPPGSTPNSAAASAIVGIGAPFAAERGCKRIDRHQRDARSQRDCRRRTGRSATVVTMKSPARATPNGALRIGATQFSRAPCVRRRQLAAGTARGRRWRPAPAGRWRRCSGAKHPGAAGDAPGRRRPSTAERARGHQHVRPAAAPVHSAAPKAAP